MGDNETAFGRLNKHTQKPEPCRCAVEVLDHEQVCTVGEGPWALTTECSQAGEKPDTALWGAHTVPSVKAELKVADDQVAIYEK